jgi:hypothetical protein
MFIIKEGIGNQNKDVLSREEEKDLYVKHEVKYGEKGPFSVPLLHLTSLPPSSTVSPIFFLFYLLVSFFSPTNRHFRATNCLPQLENSIFQIQ